MRISDWSSDVCSSDLVRRRPARSPGSLACRRAELPRARRPHAAAAAGGGGVALGRGGPGAALGRREPLRHESSDERRVEKACVSPCRSRRSPSYYQNKPTFHSITLVLI